MVVVLLDDQSNQPALVGTVHQKGSQRMRRISSGAWLLRMFLRGLSLDRFLRLCSSLSREEDGLIKEDG